MAIQIIIHGTSITSITIIAAITIPAISAAVRVFSLFDNWQIIKNVRTITYN